MRFRRFCDGDSRNARRLATTQASGHTAVRRLCYSCGIPCVPGAREGRPEPETERQEKQRRLAERADHTGARAQIPLQLPRPQDKDGIHRRPRHTWRIVRMRSTGAASASRMLCPVSAMNASSRVRPPVCCRSAAAVPSATIRP
jgi:hypothetical protein